MRRRTRVARGRVVGDGEGVVIIPANIAEEIAEEAVEMTAFEDFVIEEVSERPLDTWPISCDGRANEGRFRSVAKGERTLRARSH